MIEIKSVFYQSFGVIMNKKFILLLFLTFLLNVISNAQSDGQRRFIDLKKVPLEASVLTDFAPSGWMIEKQIQGNINFDSKPDAVLELVESNNNPDEERYRALLILTQTDNGKWRRVAAATRLLAEYSSGGMKCGSQGDNIEIKLSRKGILTVYQCLGGANLINYTHRFRYEPISKRMNLIGEDSENGSPASQITVISINFLTGVRIETHLDDIHPKGITKKSRVSTAKKFYAEDLDNEIFQENGI